MLYHATLATEYAEPLKVAKVTPALTGAGVNDSAMVQLLNQPIWYESDWKRATRYREATRITPQRITFERPKWADEYDPPYPTEALIITQLIVYIRRNVRTSPQEGGVGLFTPDAVPLNAIPAAYATHVGTYGTNQVGIYYRFPEQPLEGDELWTGILPPIKKIARVRAPADAGVMNSPFSFPPTDPNAPLTPTSGFAWGGEINAFPTNLWFGDQDGRTATYPQEVDRLTLDIVLPRRTIALRAYAMPAHRVFPDLIPYQRWLHPGDTNEPVSPDNTFTAEAVAWLVDPDKYQPGPLEEDL